MTEAKVIQVIIVNAIRGKGTSKDDPIRNVAEYWSFDGEFLADDDPTRPSTKYQ